MAVDRKPPEQLFRDGRVDVLLGTRGAENERALRVREAATLIRSTTIAIMAETLSAVSKALVSDVAMPVTGTWYDGPSIPLTKGVWMVQASVQHLRTDATGARFAARLLREADVICAAQTFHPASANAGAHLNLSAIVRVTANVIVKMQARTASGAGTAFLSATAPYAGADPATTITATRMRLLP